MKFVSWNVNGLRACLKNGFMYEFNKLDADIFALQEIKMQPDQAIIESPSYRQIWNPAQKKGYSGTMIFTRLEPLEIKLGIGVDEYDIEGRSITLEFEKFFFVNVYSPNSRMNSKMNADDKNRLEFRCRWEEHLRKYLQSLDSKKLVILCGDLNVAHQTIDLKNPASNHHSSGFTDEERSNFSQLLDAGFIDAFREKYPTTPEAYTWWSYLRHARKSNSGWRIDYFITSKRMIDLIEDVIIHQEIFGSDHCPIELKINL